MVLSHRQKCRSIKRDGKNRSKLTCAKSCLTLCNPMDCSPPDLSFRGFSRPEFFRSGLPFFTPGDLPNSGVLPHCKWILHQLSHQGSPGIRGGSESEVAQSCPTLCDPVDTRLLHPWDFLGKCTGVGCHFLLQGTSQPRDRIQVSRIVDGHFTI